MKALQSLEEKDYKRKKEVLQDEHMAPHHNLWVTFGSGSCPSV